MDTGVDRESLNILDPNDDLYDMDRAVVDLLPNEWITYNQYLVLNIEGPTEFFDGYVRLIRYSGYEISIMDRLWHRIREQLEAEKSPYRAMHSGAEVYVEREGWRQRGHNPGYMIFLWKQWQRLPQYASLVFWSNNPPAIVADVRSPLKSPKRSHLFDNGEKLPDYAIAGVQEVWRFHISEDRQGEWVEICYLVNGEYERQRFTGSDSIVSRLLPSVTLTVDEIYAPFKWDN